MDISLAALLGVLQGLTEWFPVSSSGHLALAQHYFGGGVPDAERIFFDVIVHLASMCVVLIAFRKDVRTVILSFFGIFGELRKGKRLKTVLREDPYKLFAVLILIATVPTALMGCVFQKWFEATFEQPAIIGIAMIFTGFILILTYGLAGKRKIREMSGKDAIAVGVMQGVAIIPGISRSGSTISTGMLLGLERETAARFSFLLAIPAILGALVLHLSSIPHFSRELALPLAVGFAMSFVVGYATLRSLQYIIRKQGFYAFAAYCWAMGSAVLVWIFVLGH